MEAEQSRDPRPVGGGSRRRPLGRRTAGRRAALSPALALPLALAALLSAAGGCASIGAAGARTSGAGGAGERASAGGPELAAVANLQQRALLLLMADQERFEPFVVETALSGNAALREHLAVALGRSGDPRGASYLAQLLGDPSLPVRRAAAFALGELELEREDAERSARALLLAAVEPDGEAGVLAVEALGKLGVSVTVVLGALSDSELAEEERWRRLLPPLYRFEEAAQVAVAEAGLAAAPDGELRRFAAYALSRTPRAEALPRLRELLADGDPRVRAWAARALGLVGEAGDLGRLAPLVEAAADDGGAPDPADLVDAVDAAAEYGDSAPAIQAVRAAAGLVERLGGGAADGGPVDGGPAGAEADGPRHARLDLAGWPERLAEVVNVPACNGPMDEKSLPS